MNKLRLEAKEETGMLRIEREPAMRKRRQSREY